MIGSKETILQHLRRGKENAITGGRLAQIMGEHGDRSIRLAIRELIEEGQPIASSVHPPYGYYIIETTEEYEEYKAVLRARAIDNFLRLRAFKRAAGQLFNGRQMAMEI